MHGPYLVQSSTSRDQVENPNIHPRLTTSADVHSPPKHLHAETSHQSRLGTPTWNLKDNQIRDPWIISGLRCAASNLLWVLPTGSTSLHFCFCFCSALLCSASASASSTSLHRCIAASCPQNTTPHRAPANLNRHRMMVVLQIGLPTQAHSTMAIDSCRPNTKVPGGTGQKEQPGRTIKVNQSHATSRNIGFQRRISRPDAGLPEFRELEDASVVLYGI
ncbi:hypothetical protein BJ875DRAFT_528127 [Amylocarpus encephaloides]|uniref:Uncharacterized protein n=1 Tax=Amylocarpus encephaloides TaxID=45428 RepID=A0A9P7Y6N2_9HELO|nr:hypothetical protein BJ875DRAFT_528127 [Amylocarpus encephaloides]